MRLKLGAMFSNFTESTSIHPNGADPAAENAAALFALWGLLLVGLALVLGAGRWLWRHRRSSRS